MKNSDPKTLHASNGAPVPEFGLTASTTVGPNGPIAIQDFELIDHLAHFDRERIPERVVHAKGGGAFGYFETTHDSLASICKAKLFSSVGKRCPIAMRFSTVGGESGSADTVRDPRGFAMKFYTEEGNWDLVGNNTPIFFIRDPILFPSFIHTQKREPHTHLKNDQMQWDFFSLRPEALHQVSFLYSDRGTPDGFRHMNGYGSHTYVNVNAQGETTFVKYHFKTDQGIRNLSVARASELAGSDPDYAIRDLYEAIERKDYPTWTMYIQKMTMRESQSVEFDPFDVTKVWPHKQFPLIEVGRIVLNRNPQNYFAEIEQLAFSPSHFIPGIAASRDKMLQARLFSYPDTHRHRLGVNYQQLPVNRPLFEPRTYQRDGAMCFNGNMGSLTNYFPNSVAEAPTENPEYAKSAEIGLNPLDATVIKKYSTKDNDNFTQVGVFYNKVLNDAERERLTDNLASSLVKVTIDVRNKVFPLLEKCDPHYGKRVREKVEQAAAKSQEEAEKMRDTAPLNPPRKPFKAMPPSEATLPRL